MARPEAARGTQRSEYRTGEDVGEAAPLTDWNDPSLWLWSWRRRERSDRLTQLPSLTAASVGRQAKRARGNAP